MPGRDVRGGKTALPALTYTLLLSDGLSTVILDRPFDRGVWCWVTLVGGSVVINFRLASSAVPPLSAGVFPVPTEGIMPGDRLGSLQSWFGLFRK